MARSDPRAQELLEKYHSAKLTPAETRELARISLTDDDILDELAIDGAIEESLTDAEFREKWLTQPLAEFQQTRGRRYLWLAIACAACLILVLGVLMRSRPVPEIAQAPSPPASRPPAVHTTPALGPNARPDQPVLLAASLTPPMVRGDSVRSVEGRGPRGSGNVSEADEQRITIDLGWVDGLAAGDVVTVTRGAKVIGKFRIGVVFREQSRATAMDTGAAEPGDEIGIDPARRLKALWSSGEAARTRGDLKEARRVAQAAVNLAGSMKVNPRLMRTAQERLAEAEFQDGDPASAKERYRKLVSGEARPEQQGAWEALGAISLLTGDKSLAKDAFTRAEELAASLRYRAAHARALNNLAVLAEMDGDVVRARQLLKRAASTFRGGPNGDRLAIQKNLARLK